MISISAREKIKEHQKRLEIKSQFNVYDAYIFRTPYGYGISFELKFNTATRRDLKLIRDPDELQSALETMSNGSWQVINLDTDERFNNLEELLEYYYITKLARI